MSGQVLEQVKMVNPDQSRRREPDVRADSGASPKMSGLMREPDVQADSGASQK